MREHGAILPAASGAGGSTTAPTKRVDTKSAAYRQAMRTCGPLLNAALTGATRSAAKPSAGVVPAKAPPRPKVKLPPALMGAMERFTACMRSNGVAGFPEPKEGRFDLAGTGLNPESPQYKAAGARCNPILNAAFSKA